MGIHYKKIPHLNHIQLPGDGYSSEHISCICFKLIYSLNSVKSIILASLLFCSPQLMKYRIIFQTSIESLISSDSTQVKLNVFAFICGV